MSNILLFLCLCSFVRNGLVTLKLSRPGTQRLGGVDVWEFKFHFIWLFLMCGTTVSVSHTKYIIRHRLLFFASWYIYIYFVIISETTTFHVIKLLHLYPPTFKWHHDLPVYWIWYRILATHLLSENETSTTHRKNHNVPTWW